MSSRVPLVVGNWKMHGMAADLGALAALADGVARGGAGRAICAICPPATLIHRAVETVAGRLAIGAQDCAVEAAGAHTGDISAPMIRDAGARLVIVGHSERRAQHGETDALVQAKALAAMQAGLSVIVCVGESQADHDAGRARAVVGGQLAGSVPRLASASTFVVAYEPVWAIGSGHTPSDHDIAGMHGFIRDRLVEQLGGVAQGVRVLYGGSVKPGNAAALMAVADVDGALIGGASLTAEDFLAIAGVYR